MLNRRRLLTRTGAVVAIAAAGAAALFPRRVNAYYSGPLSDHFDGTRFFNPGGSSPKGLSDVARFYMAETWSQWPTRISAPEPDRPPGSVIGNTVRIVFVGHASWLVQAPGCNILLDPVWSDRVSPFSFAGPRRANPPGIAFDDLPPIQAVLVTHNHYDHLDLETLGRLWQRHRPRLVTPLGNDTIIRAAIPDLVAEVVDWGAGVTLPGGVIAHAVPTQHWSARGIRDRSHALWASFVLETPAGLIYAVGDSGFGDGRTFRHVGARFPGVRMALLPIGAYEPRWFMESQHMNPADAVEAFRLCGAERALGHHWGTFQLTTEPHDQPPALLATAMDGAGLAAERFRAMRPGDVVTI